MKKIILFSGLLLGLLLTACTTTGGLTNDDRSTTGDKSENTKVLVISNPQSLADFLIRIPGVYVDDRLGGTTVTVRGNVPLYVVDNIPLGYSYAEANNAVSAFDIDSVEVLKGPSETALYGRRGANGVIVIRTKRN